MKVKSFWTRHLLLRELPSGVGDDELKSRLRGFVLPAACPRSSGLRFFPMDAEWLSAIVLLLLMGAFMWRSGASARQIAIVVGVAALAIVATALFWDWVASGDG